MSYYTVFVCCWFPGVPAWRFLGGEDAPCSDGIGAFWKYIEVKDLSPMHVAVS